MNRAVVPVAVLLVLALASLLLGARGGVGPGDLLSLIRPPAPDDAAGIVVRELRLPRMLGAVFAGGALGAAGALIQGLTRNPLADPGLLGINAGAALAIVGTVWLGGPSGGASVLPAMVGAFAAAGIVWAIGSASRGVLTLILAGAALTAILSGALRAIVLIDAYALDAFRYWTVGAFDGVRMATLLPALPLVAVGAGLGALTARKIDAIGLGDDMARALGTSLAVTRMQGLAAVALLSAGAVLIAGPLAFVGLVAPHLARMTGASGTFSIMARAATMGAGLCLAADIAGRVILPGRVIEAGLGVTLIGGPFLIWLVRREARNPA